MDTIQIGKRQAGGGNLCFIIAEAGLNHNGDAELAKCLIREAARCGADAVKFQTYTTNELFPPDHPEFDAFERHVFSKEIYRSLIQEAMENQIIFLSTPFDEASADLLDSLDVAAFKVGSGELTHHHFLKYLAAKQRPMILSTGMSTLEHLDCALEAIFSEQTVPLALLHCVSAYPCPLEDVHVGRVAKLKERYQMPIGFSDHTRTDTAAIAAVALGACIVEKHFTLSHHLPGWDHHFSYDPEEMARFIRVIREAEKTVRPDENGLKPSEQAIEKIARRAVYARVDIKAGDILSEKNLVARRPVGPVSADQLEALLGKKTNCNIPAGAPLLLSHIE